MILIIVATISLTVALFSETKYKWLESVTIYFAVVFAGLVQAFCDWLKEKQFLRLHSLIIKDQTKVIRNKDGLVQDILVSDLVVGDIIVLEQGDRVPADCLLVQEIDMFVDQSYYTGGFDEEQRNVEKQCSYGNV